MATTPERESGAEQERTRGDEVTETGQPEGAPGTWGAGDSPEQAGTTGTAGTGMDTAMGDVEAGPDEETAQAEGEEGSEGSR